MSGNQLKEQPVIHAGDTPRDNPLGVTGFEFVEYASPQPEQLHALFRNMGFSAVARHKRFDITLYRQGNVSFLVNEEEGSFASQFAKDHGPCCVGFSFRVDDRFSALKSCVEKGAIDMTGVRGAALSTPAISGIGNSLLYLTDLNSGNPFAEEYEAIEEADFSPQGFGLTYIDHLTNNVFDGNMDKWGDFYSRLFNFYEVKYFDIKGQQTGLRSRAMTSPDGAISIPINESSEPGSQINEYLDQYRGEGVQHIALYTEDIYTTVEAMREAGMKFLDTPDTYYEVIDQRVPKHEEDVGRMRKNRILIDADPETGTRQLLQIFTDVNIGPIFFEIIQRKGNKGFGEGNFQALFESIELDQIRRGVL
ncbi:MAG TPA: 4-hydroxyphenylpyruvate dioxygenase [Xanthomonadales bacterium]|nr:4-hydroxyphenylpyruvate dioxygenase [Xanthomonadales bacterium]